MQEFNIAYFEISEWFDNLSNKFDLYVIEQCDHFLDDGTNSFLESMRSIQTISAIVFFFAIHIPLSRLHNGFSFFTCIIPIMLNLNSKIWFYEKANQFVCKVFKNDPYAKNHIKKPKSMVQNQPVNLEDSDISDHIKMSHDELESQENSVWLCMFWLVSFFSFFFNFFYSIYLQEVMVS